MSYYPCFWVCTISYSMAYTLRAWAIEWKKLGLKLTV